MLRSKCRVLSSSVNTPHRDGYSEIIGKVNQHCLFDQNISHYLRKNSRRFNKENALHSFGIKKRWTFGDLRKQVEYLSRNLLSLGVRPSERVLSFSSGTGESHLFQLACSILGCMYVAIPPDQFNADKLRSFLNQFQPQILYVNDRYKDKKDGREIQSSFYDTLLSVIPELAFSYPGQTLEYQQSQEFPYLKKCIVSGCQGESIKEKNRIKQLLPSVYSYHEEHLARFNLLIHADEPILSLWNHAPPLEDKVFVSFSHSQCMNAGGLFANVLGLNSNSRVSFLPYHSCTPLGAIVVPFAAIGSGFEFVLSTDKILQKASLGEGISELNEQRLSCLVGHKSDFDLLLTGDHAKELLPIKNVAIFEDSSDLETGSEYMANLKKILKADDVFVFRGPIESCYMMTHRSANQGELGILPYCGIKVVGDRGTYDAKILARGMRGNLRMRGPHITPHYYSNAGFLSELQDEFGWISTSRDGRIHADGSWETLTAQIY